MAKVQKIYYKISEVSELTGVEEHKLRYWETKVKTLKPRRIEGKQRYYTKKEIEIIEKIKLLLSQGIKLEAVDSYLKGKKKKVFFLDEIDIDKIKNKNKKVREKKKTYSYPKLFNEISVQLKKIMNLIKSHYNNTY